MTWKEWLKEICEAPDDCLPKLAAADWLEERSLAEEGACLRWCGSKESPKRPYPANGNKNFVWFNGDKVQAGLEDKESDVPEALYLLLEGGEEKANHKRWPSREAAFEALIAAWKKARLEGWVANESS